MKKIAPEDWHTITPRIFVNDPAAFIAFLKRVFDATGDFESDAPSEILIGDSRLMISGTGQREKFPAFLYVYVADADVTAKWAVEAGAVLLEEVWDTPYGDRRAMVKDPWDNVWQIATHKAVKR
jgi:uncharacterized glyoxalase superfamily protein PhnB